jgi:hypothetical protein
MSDLLSACSILLGILTALYGMFYSSINEILELTPKTHPIDDTSNFKRALIVRKTKIFPLLIASILLTLIFIPEAYKIIYQGIAFMANNGIVLTSYDTIKTTYLSVTVFMIIFTLNIIVLSFKFNTQIGKLNPKRKI